MVNTKRAKLLAKIGIVLIIFYFFGKSLYQNWGQIDFRQLHLNWGLLIASTFSLFGYFFLFAFMWTLILKKMGISLSFLKGVKIIFYSQLGKYIPGKVWAFAGRMYFCQKIGIPNSKTFISIVLELALTIISGILVFLVALSVTPGFKINVNPFFLILLVIIFFTIIHPKILTRIMNIFLRFMKKEPIRINLSFSQICSMMGYYCIIWLCFGMAFYFLISSTTFITVSKIPILAGSFSVSTTIGVMTLFAPGGLGVREGVLALLLSNFFPISLAILLSFLCRIWLIVGELIMVGISTRIKL
jgi:uncharacterized membrane protein YbhN (UPF0104 family)